MNITPIKKQHYVSRLYLKYWQIECNKNNNKILWAKNKDRDEIFEVSDLNTICQKNKFYRVDIDRDVYEILKYKYEPLIDNPLIRDFMRELEALHCVNIYIKNKEHNYENLDVININFLEKKYAKIENSIAVTLSELNDIVSNDISLTSISPKSIKQHYQNLIALSCIQYFRTKEARSNIMRIINEMSLKRSDGSIIKFSEKQIETTLKIILFLESALLADDVYKNRFTIRFLNNKSDIHFITSSSPTIFNKKLRNLSDLKCIMPLSPRLSMLIYKSKLQTKTITCIDIDRNGVEDQNNIIYKYSGYDVYATTKEQLDDF